MTRFFIILQSALFAILIVGASAGVTNDKASSLWGKTSTSYEQTPTPGRIVSLSHLSIYFYSDMDDHQHAKDRFESGVLIVSSFVNKNKNSAKDHKH